MLIVKLKGGLGNQLFQYAFGRALSMQANQALVLDISHFGKTRQGETPRAFCLHHYGIAARVGLPWWAQKAWRLRKGRMMKTFGELGLGKIREVRETSFRYEKIDAPAGRGLWSYEGYWQAPRYFEQARPFLLKELVPVRAAQGMNEEVLNQIRQSNAVSVHIRRGDYVSDAAISAFHGICGLNYYRDAMQGIGEQIQDPVFYVFSDDIAWAKSHIQSIHPMVFVDHNDDETAFEDLRLMSECRHHIIANSSFSWWAAWLNPRAEKKVIAPRRWFADTTVSCDDLIPDTWSRI